MDMEYHCDDYCYGAMAEPALGLGGRGLKPPYPKNFMEKET